jgi:hypothetical protein
MVCFAYRKNRYKKTEDVIKNACFFVAREAKYKNKTKGWLIRKDYFPLKKLLSNL